MEESAEHGPAQVEVDEDDVTARAGECDREVGDGGRLALPRAGARHHHRLCVEALVREVEARAQPRHGLGRLVRRPFEDRRRIAPTRSRQLCEQRNLQLVLDLVGVPNAAIECAEGERATDPEHEPEEQAEGRTALRRRSDLAGAVGRTDDRGRREQDLERPQILRLAQKLLVRLRACRARLSEFREPALDLAAGAGEARRVGLELVLSERRRICVRQAGGDVGISMRDGERQDVGVGIGGHVGSPALDVLQPGYLDRAVAYGIGLGEPLLCQRVAKGIGDRALGRKPGDRRAEILPIEKDVRRGLEDLRRACRHDVCDGRHDQRGDDDHPLVAPNDAEVVGDRLLSGALLHGHGLAVGTVRALSRSVLLEHEYG